MTPELYHECLREMLKKAEHRQAQFRNGPAEDYWLWTGRACALDDALELLGQVAAGGV